jgi:hypothetical protein
MSEVTTAEQLQTAQAAWRQLLPGQLRVLEDIQGSRELYLSPTNLKNNIAIGHTMAKKLPTNTRFFGFNINGIKLDPSGRSRHH